MNPLPGQNPVVLVVEDEHDVARLVEYNLREAGYGVVVAGTAREAHAALDSPDLPDLVILDLMLPDLPGTTLCREIRQDPRTRKLPVLMLTARASELDRVVGFELGADDYVTKPFSVRELVLRVGALLRRASGAAEGEASRLVLGPLDIDVEAHVVRLDGKELALTPIEFRFIEYLASRPGRLCPREVLLRDVWKYAPGIDTRTVDTHVKRLRQKLGRARDTIETVRGIGYRAKKDQ